MTKKNNILIVEPSDIIREGLAAILSSSDDAPFAVAQCNGEPDLQHSVHKAAPRVLIASPATFEQNEKQINTLKEEYHLLLVALIYTFQHPERLAHYDGQLYINETSEKIQTSIQDLLQSHATPNAASHTEPLTDREKEILKLLVGGNATKQIATALHISTHTVNAHRKNIMRKLDIKTISGLTIYAVLNNIITLKEA